MQHLSLPLHGWGVPSRAEEAPGERSLKGTDFGPTKEKV